MEDKGTVVLTTERLILRRFTVSDAQDMFENWASDPDVTKFLTWQTHGDLETTRSLMERWVASYARADFYQWAIVLKKIDQPIGSISVVRRDETSEEVEIGYCIGKAWWGQGITAEAFGAVIDFLFGEVGVKRIVAKHDVNNPNSGKVMQKCGLKYEKTMPGAGRNNSNPNCDLAVYSLQKA